MAEESVEAESALSTTEAFTSVRPRAWRSPDPSLQNVEAAIKPELATIMANGGFDYPSMDMKKGICVAGLVKFAKILHGLMLLLVQRGGSLLGLGADRLQLARILGRPQHAQEAEVTVTRSE